MKVKLSIIAVMVFFAAVSGTGWTVEYPTLGNPVGSGTSRSNDLRRGLIRSPNPIDTSGNLVITGNVRGGRDFRGIVPYQANTDFRDVTGSSSLDSFLRSSAGSEDFGSYTGAYRPFFSPSRTVTTTRPGQARVIRPPTMVIGRPVADSEAIRESPYPSSKQPVLYVGGDTSGRGRTDVDFAAFQMQKSVLRIPTIVHGMGVRRPMSMTLSEMERTILAEVGIPILQDKDRMETRREATVLREMWKEQFRLESEGVERIDAEFKKGSVGEQDESLRSQAGEILGRDAVPPLELQKLRTQPIGDRQQGEERDRKEGQQLDIYGHMEQQIAELQKSYEELMAAEAAKTTSGATKVVLEREGAAGGEKGPSKESHSFVGSISARSGEVEASHPKAGAVIGDSGELASLASGRLARSGVWASDTMPVSDGADFSARAKSILGPYKDAPAFWASKFNGHMASAEKYLEEGRFYRSADAYTLALVYKPEEPLAYMGKSHALFAAGEYMSSALFLSRAVTAVGEGQKKKDYEVQQLLALGSRFLAYIDKDKIENRVVDIEQWQQRSGSAELQFLLGYLYYQMGRLDVAGEAIDAAFKQMPEALAVIALREVIHSKKLPHEGKNP